MKYIAAFEYTNVDLEQNLRIRMERDETKVSAITPEEKGDSQVKRQMDPEKLKTRKWRNEITGHPL
jgi:hypothetical protein